MVRSLLRRFTFIPQSPCSITPIDEEDGETFVDIEASNKWRKRSRGAIDLFKVSWRYPWTGVAKLGYRGEETVKLVKLPGGWTESSRPAVPCENQLIDDDPFKGCRPTPTDSFFLLTCLSRRASIFAGKVAS